MRLPTLIETLRIMAALAYIVCGTMAQPAAAAFLNDPLLGWVLVTFIEFTGYICIHYLTTEREVTDLSKWLRVVVALAAFSCAAASVEGIKRSAALTVEQAQSQVEKENFANWQRLEKQREATLESYRTELTEIDQEKHPKDHRNLVETIAEYSQPTSKQAAQIKASPTAAPEEYQLIIAVALHAISIINLGLAGLFSRRENRKNEELQRVEKELQKVVNQSNQDVTPPTPNNPPPTSGQPAQDPVAAAQQEKENKLTGIVDNIADDLIPANKQGYTTAAGVQAATGCTNPEAREAIYQAFAEGYLLDNDETGGARRFFRPRHQPNQMRAV